MLVIWSWSGAANSSSGIIRAAARRMIEKRSEVIVTITGMPARIATPGTGAWAGIEALTRGLAAELGPPGIRAVCLRANTIPEAGVGLCKADESCIFTCSGVDDYDMSCFFLLYFFLLYKEENHHREENHLSRSYQTDLRTSGRH